MMKFEIIRNQPGKYPGKSWGFIEFPLFDKYVLCPSARYVGGTSKYLCECKQPTQCPGVQAVVQTYYHDQIEYDPAITEAIETEDWKRVATLSTYSGEIGEQAQLVLNHKFGPLTELQVEVLAALRDTEHFNLADSVEQNWRRGKMAYVDGRTPIPGIRRKFDRANKEMLTRIGERVIKGESA